MSEGTLQTPSGGQKIFDNIWLLATIGLAIPFVFYFFWGLWEIFTIPQADYSFILGGN